MKTAAEGPGGGLTYEKPSVGVLLAPAYRCHADENKRSFLFRNSKLRIPFPQKRMN